MDNLNFLYWDDPFFDPERRTNKHRMETMSLTDRLALPITLAQVLKFILDCTAADLDAIETACADREESLDIDDDDNEDDEDDEDDGQPDDSTEVESVEDNLVERESDEVIDKID